MCICLGLYFHAAKINDVLENFINNFIYNMYIIMVLQKHCTLYLLILRLVQKEARPCLQTGVEQSHL